ncbi:MAG: efflux RND transporter periplasmic adaptor subunit [Sulfuricella sp.]|nr:efflux RND transporter periplasmic adaptor subunit [Sulfuricella sp.]
MAQTDLSRLHIERGSAHAASPRRRWPYLVALAVVLGGVGLLVASGNRPLAVETASVVLAYPSQSLTLLNATGYVVAQRKAAVASKATGRLEWLGVREGSVVKAGEVVARLENRDVTAARDRAGANVQLARATLEQVQAEAHNAEQEYRRALDLLAKGFISQSAVDGAEARLLKARAGVNAQNAAIVVGQAALREAEVALDATLIRAPFDGVILTKQANVGDVITPFAAAADSKGAVVTMADMGTLEVEADVSESSLAKVKPGQPCEIQLDALPGSRFLGEVARLVPTVDRAKATVIAKVRFLESDRRILPEMSAKVAFLERALKETERQPRLAVNPDTLAERGGQTVLFRAEKDAALAVPVQPGEKLGEVQAILGEVKPGDKVVLKPAAKLESGAKVSVAAKP